MMFTPFVFFDLGQTLIDEWEFIEYLDGKLLEILNGFGAKIDRRNYLSIRDSVIRDRKIGHGSVRELVVEVSKLLFPPGYEKTISSRLEPEIIKGRSSAFKFSRDAPGMLEKLAEMKIETGLIANQSQDIMQVLKQSGLEKYFKVIMISSSIQFAKPDPRIFQMALDKAARPPNECVMVGDRLDTDICPAKSLGMITIRYTNSLFSLQQPLRECEFAAYSVDRLPEIPYILERIISR
jgi:HAD superfamily hydrolase (TIGR01549 family)